MTQQEKERLADRVVEILKDPDPLARLRTLQRRVEGGDEGPDGNDSVVLALTTALIEQMGWPRRAPSGS
jgi:hypothetical protein